MLSENIITGSHISKYRIVANINTNPTSSVFQATHSSLKNSIIAIKLIHGTHLLQRRRDQFLKEAELLKKLKHPYILPILDVGIYEDMPYFVTPYASGGSLRERNKLQPAQLLPMHEALSILSQVGQALQYAHQYNIIHGKLKPENILFNEEDNVQLADFSMVTTTDAFRADHPLRNSTFPYIAPEQFEGWITKESDQYALGCIAYELSTGQPPFPTSSFSEFKHKHTTEKPTPPTQLNLLLPISLEETILKAMEQKSEDRFPGVKDFIMKLDASTPAYIHAPRQPYVDAAIPPPSFSSTGAGGNQELFNSSAESAHASTLSMINFEKSFQEGISNLQDMAVLESQRELNEHKPVFTDVSVQQKAVPVDVSQDIQTAKVPLSSPFKASHRHSLKDVNRITWLILVSLMVVIVVIVFALSQLVLSSSFRLNPGLKSSSRNPALTSTLTLRSPVATSKPVPTPTHPSASNVAPTPTRTPTPTPSPTTVPSPTPTSSPALPLIVTPTSFHAESDCQKSTSYYVCSAILQPPQNQQGNVQWSSSSNNITAFFYPSKGTLAPGQQQQVIIYVLASCPQSGSLIFSTIAGRVTVPWNC